MAAKIGILGESTVVTNGTITTVYTVPADKAARVRLLFALEGGAAGSDYRIYIGSPGSEWTFRKAPGNNGDVFCGVVVAGGASSPIFVGPEKIGIIYGAAVIDISSDEFLLIPLPIDYFLSTGDTIRFRIGDGDAVQHLIQVYGVEDDA